MWTIGNDMYKEKIIWLIEKYYWKWSVWVNIHSSFLIANYSRFNPWNIEIKSHHIEDNLNKKVSLNRCKNENGEHMGWNWVSKSGCTRMIIYIIKK